MTNFIILFSVCVYWYYTTIINLKHHIKTCVSFTNLFYNTEKLAFRIFTYFSNAAIMVFKRKLQSSVFENTWFFLFLYILYNTTPSEELQQIITCKKTIFKITSTHRLNYQANRRPHYYRNLVIYKSPNLFYARSYPIKRNSKSIPIKPLHFKLYFSQFLYFVKRSIITSDELFLMLDYIVYLL